LVNPLTREYIQNLQLLKQRDHHIAGFVQEMACFHDKLAGLQVALAADFLAERQRQSQLVMELKVALLGAAAAGAFLYALVPAAVDT
jgi:hypothetical protein